MRKIMPGGMRGSIEPAARPPAPAYLSTVQRFVNTNDREGGTDLLGSPVEARRWLTRQGLLSRRGTVSSREFHRVIALREALRSLMSVHSGSRADPASLATVANEVERSDLRVEVSRGGAFVFVSRAQKEVNRALGAILAQVAASQARGDWLRLKACARDVCRWVFYDRSVNRSGTWCAMAICGSREKARRYYYKRHRVAARSPRQRD